MDEKKKEVWIRLFKIIMELERHFILTSPLFEGETMKRVYIASPYSKGDQAINVRRQIDCANELMDLNFVPYAPLMSHFQHLVHPRSIEDWYKFDNEWVMTCHYLLRLSGESKGADDEVKLAKELGIPVFHSILELVSWDNVANGGN